ncbi:MAG: S9 family peptidase [Candidatus Eisenbacteria bacterium]
MAVSAKRSKSAAAARPNAGKKGARAGLDFATMMKIERIADPQVSPDGRRVVFVMTEPDLSANVMRRSLHLLDLGSGAIRELTPGPGNHMDPAWSPDGEKIAFVSTRAQKEGSQVWVLPVNGGEARRVTTGYGGAHNPVWAPDSRRIAFWRETVVSETYQPGKSEAIDARTGPGNAAVYGLSHPKSSAKIADALLFRHWDRWRDRRRKHLFVVDSESRKTVDLTPYDCDVPPISLGSTVDYAFHPDGTEIAFVMNPDAVVARSTNNSIFLQTLRGLATVGAPRSISTSDACDAHPRYSEDGSRVFYLAMELPGYEADRCRIKEYDRATGETRVHLERFDRSPDEFYLHGSRVTFAASDRGYRSLYRYDLDKQAVSQLTEGLYLGSVRPLPGSDDVIVTYETTTTPADLYRLTPGKGIAAAKGAGGTLAENQAQAKARNAATATGASRLSARLNGGECARLTRIADGVAPIGMNEAEEFWFAGAGDTPVHGFLIRPVGFRPDRKIPLILLIHGGPQSAFSDHFHYRWNSQVFASRGAAVAMINPRGSTGYGQRFTDQISGDWGGRAYQDLMRGVDYLLSHYSFLDGKQVAAAGASFGGFMVNWIAGQTDRFRALVSHDGIFHAETMGFTTEELWFDEHEHGGAVYEKRASFLKYSPHLHTKSFRTPTLVVRGGQGFRCPESEGVAMFQALQMNGVASASSTSPMRDTG